MNTSMQSNNSAPQSGTRQFALKAWDLELTRAETEAEADRIAARLRAEYEIRRRPVAVLAKNSGRTLVTYLATVLSGAPLVPLNVHLHADEVRHMLIESDAGTLFTGPELLDVAVAATADLDGSRLCVGRSVRVPGSRPSRTGPMDRLSRRPPNIGCPPRSCSAPEQPGGPSEP
ncbi:AMP-binding protein [Prescottella defluvii]|nr:AMP-binding protein [Prescottella defluvii]